MQRKTTLHHAKDEIVQDADSNFSQTPPKDVEVSLRQLAENGGGSSLTYNNATITSSNLNCSEDNVYNCTIAGLTNNRGAILPAPSAAGKIIRINILDGDADYALTPIGDIGVTIDTVGGTWKPMFIAGETVTLESTSTSNWQVIEDGLKPCLGVAERQAAQAINTTTTTKVAFDAAVTNRGGIVDVTTNDRINIRRGGVYNISGQTSIENLDDGEYVIASLFIDGASVVSLRMYNGGDANLSLICPLPTKGITLTAGQYIELYVRHNEGATQNTGTGGLTPYLYVQEVL
jgi:hypothetical protein